MINHTNLILWLILWGVCVQLSCNSIRDFIKTPVIDQGPDWRASINQQTDTVALDILTIHLAPHQNELLQQLWQEVDEQLLPSQLRRELLAEGFRVGLLGNSTSPTLAQLLQVSSEGNEPTLSAQEVTRESNVSRNTRILLPDMRALVKIFDEQNALPELALFRRENGMLEGQTYANAVGVFCVSAAANNDGSAQVQIVPELEYGILGRKIRTVAGMVTWEESRPRRSFESLTISHRLLQGQWILLGTTTADSTGVGKAFFVRQSPVPEQRLIAIRLVRATPATEK